MKISNRLLQAASAAIQTDGSLATAPSLLARIYALESAQGIAHTSDPLIEEHHAQYCERDLETVTKRVKELQTQFNRMDDTDADRNDVAKQIKAAQAQAAAISAELDAVQGVAPAPAKKK